MQPDTEAEGRRWFQQATDDLHTATKLREIGIHYAACFFAQQAAEKALKSVLYAAGAERVRGHAVVELADEAARVNASLAGLSDEAAPLDAYYIPTRYPNGLAGGVASRVFQAEDSERALRLAARVVNSVRTSLPAASSSER